MEVLFLIRNRNNLEEVIAMNWKLKNRKRLSVLLA